MDHAILVADRLGTELLPLTERTCVGLLPFADEVQRIIGEGTRWGLRLTYTLTRGEEDPTALVDRLGRRLEGPFVALRGDRIYGFDVAGWISTAKATAGDRVWAEANGVSASCGIQSAGTLDLAPLSWPPPRRIGSGARPSTPVSSCPTPNVGELVEITNAIVSANTMIRVDSGAVLHVTDACLLADLEQATLGGGIADPIHRLLGVLALSLPLWPIAALAALLDLMIRIPRPRGSQSSASNPLGRSSKPAGVAATRAASSGTPR